MREVENVIDVRGMAWGSFLQHSIAVTFCLVLLFQCAFCASESTPADDVQPQVLNPSVATRSELLRPFEYDFYVLLLSAPKRGHTQVRITLTVYSGIVTLYAAADHVPTHDSGTPYAVTSISLKWMAFLSVPIRQEDVRVTPASSRCTTHALSVAKRTHLVPESALYHSARRSRLSTQLV